MPEIDAFTGFLTLAALMTILAVWIPVCTLRRSARTGSGMSRDAANTAVHRSELVALRNAAASGVLSATEYRAAEDEIMRRMLADLAPLPNGQPLRLSRRMLCGTIALCIPALAAALYLAVGNPHAIREATDPAPITALTADGLPAAAARLERHLARAPNDARAWIMLARIQAELNHFAASAAAFERGLAASPKVARDPLVWCEFADALGMAQGRSLRGRPREFIEKALALDSRHHRALEMAGSAEYEAGNFAAAVTYWSRLLDQMEPGTQAHRELAAAITRSERLALLGPR